MLHGQAIFVDSFGTGWTNTGKNVVFDMSLDPGILHRAEWIRFAALFFNEEAAAGTIFSQIEDDYNALMAEAKELQKTSSFASGLSAPSVAISLRLRLTQSRKNRSDSFSGPETLTSNPSLSIKITYFGIGAYF